MQPELSIIIPFHNEEATIGPLIAKLFHSVPEAEIIFVDDGSTDASLSIVKLSARPKDRVISKKNGGKGSAIRAGLSHAEGEYTIIQDADLEYEPADILRLLHHAKVHDAKAVYGSRRLFLQERYYSRLRYYIGGILLNATYNVLYREKLTDMNTCYKMVKTDLLRSFPLKENGFGLDAEITALLARHGITIHELGVVYHPRSRDEGKKIVWLDFFHLLAVLIRVRFLRISSPKVH